MLRLPVCQRVADDPKYRPLFRDPFISDYLLMQIFRREKKHMLPYLLKQGLSEAEASALFLFLVSGAFAVNRDYDWQKVYDLCCLRIDNNAAVVRFKFASKEDFEAARSEWIEGDSPGSVAQYYLSVHGLDRVEYHCGVLDNFYTIYYIF